WMLPCQPSRSLPLNSRVKPSGAVLSLRSALSAARPAPPSSAASTAPGSSSENSFFMRGLSLSGLLREAEPLRVIVRRKAGNGKEKLPALPVVPVKETLRVVPILRKGEGRAEAARACGQTQGVTMRLGVTVPLANEETTIDEFLDRVLGQLTSADRVFCVLDT